VWTPETQERFDFSVWYPGRAATSEFVLEGWIINAGRRGRIAPGLYPVVLVSHDTAGSRFANNDLASALASAGMIVIAPTHTGDSQTSIGGIYTAELLRDRPRTLLHALETVLENQEFGPYVDENRIGLIGVGFGSISVLQLLGLEPDFSLLKNYCQNSSPKEGFCSSWAAKRLAILPETMREIAKRQGNNIFNPHLGFFGPDSSALSTPAMSGVRSPQKPLPSAGAPKNSWWQGLFDWGGDDDDTFQDSPALPENTLESDEDKILSADMSLSLDLQGGPVFGWADSGERFVKIPNPDFPGNKDQQSPETASSPPPLASSTSSYSGDQRPKTDGTPVQKPTMAPRHIRAIALLVPAGGMLFNQEELHKINIPAAIIEAGQDKLYPPEQHSRPYLSGLPRLPAILRVEEADHFSLFARCSQDTAASLKEACGALSGDERARINKQRDQFLVSFFQSMIGEALPATSTSQATPTRP
jgi:predicted dienelactone hydrolase